MSDDDDEFLDRLEADPIGVLAEEVSKAGLIMTLHGIPIDADGLRVAALESAVTRLRGKKP